MLSNIHYFENVVTGSDLDDLFPHIFYLKCLSNLKKAGNLICL